MFGILSDVTRLKQSIEDLQMTEMLSLSAAVADEISQLLAYKHHKHTFTFQGSCVRSHNKIQGFSRHFQSIIQGEFNALLPVNRSIAYSPTGTQEKTHRFEAFVHDIY